MPPKTIYPEDIKKLVIQRIKAMPTGIVICFGDGKDLSKDDMVKLINSNDELGNEIIEMHLNYLRSLKKMVM